MKKLLSATFLLILFNLGCLFLIYDKIDDDYEDYNVIVDVEEKSDEKEEPIEHVLKDNKVYKSLSIKNIKVTDSKSNLSINWFYNSSNKQYYLYLPASFDRNKLNVNFDIDHETIISVYSEDGKLLGQSYNKEITNLFKYDKVILKLETNVKKVNKYTINICSSNIPTVFIDVDGGKKAFKQILASKDHSFSKSGSLSVIDTDGNILNIDMKKFKGRGNSTWKKSKKPFAVKTNKACEILGMKSAKDWVLLTNYLDGSLSRTSLFFYLADELGLDYTPEYRPVDLVINNQYYGSYLLTSKVESNESRVDNDDGYLLEIDNYPEKDSIKLNSGKWITIKNPDIEDMSKKELTSFKKELKQKLDKLESVMKSSKTTKEVLEKYIDLESFAKYYWIQELSLNFDAMSGSIYFYYKDGKFYMGPLWDVDNTLNRGRVYASTTGYYILNDPRRNIKIKGNWYKWLFNKNYFQEIVDEVFIKNLELFESLLEKLDEYYNLIDTSSKMNYIVWPYKQMKKEVYKWNRVDKSYRDSRRLLKTALSERIEWYKKQYNLYYGFEYEIENTNDKKTGEFTKNLSVKLDSKYEDFNMIIYAKLKDGTRKQINVLRLKKGNNEFDVILNKKTSTKYKKNNQSKYHLSVIVS